MDFEIIHTTEFNKSFKAIKKKQHSLITDFKELLELLKKTPDAGLLMKHNIRKIRLALSCRNEGKSGGCRVLYIADETPPRQILFVDIYDKRETESVPHHILKAIVDNHNKE